MQYATAGTALIQLQIDHDDVLNIESGRCLQ